MTTLTDLRYGLRLLRRQPGFSLVAILTIALGIAATTLIFSVADGVMLKPLPWPDAERLVRLTETRQGRGGRVAGTVSNGTFLAWSDRPATLVDLGGWLTQTATLSGAGDPTRVSIIPTTPSLFPLLKAHPLIGRLFQPDEGKSGQPGVAILSFGLWQERFGGRTDVVGSVVRLDERPYTIVGVMPREFAFPDHEARAWTAWQVPPVIGEGGALVGVIFRALGRLRDDATPAQAAAEGTARARSAPDMSFAARALFGAVEPIDIAAEPELQAQTSQVRPAILIVFAAVALLLVTSIANVASLQLARATTRRRELAIRAAIGAGEHRVLRQLIVESSIVGLSGGAAGIVFAMLLHALLPSVLPPGFPRLDAVALDVRALIFALVASVVAGIACGLLPAWHMRRVAIVESLAVDGSAPVGGGLRSRVARTRGVIMAAQMAVACVLLVGAGLLIRSFLSLIEADRGYDPVNVLTARLPLPPGYPAERRDQLLETLVEQMRAIPGVTHAAYGTALPFVSSGGFTAFNMRSPKDPAVEVNVQATQRIVSPDYFAAMRLRLVEGRTLSNSDTATSTPAIVVNRSFATQFLGEHPVGTRIPRRGPSAGGLTFADPNADWEVVGVVVDMRQDGVQAPSQPEVFALLKQLAPGAVRSFDPILVVRTASDPSAYVASLRAIVRRAAPEIAVDSVMTMEDRVMSSLATSRLHALVIAAFGTFAALIAGVGLFGVLSFSVAQRTRELGIRSALGADG